jgi:tetratricopeptide (TPR) repeat protein
MATYNKRGYKTPKEKAETGGEYIEDDVLIEDKDSTTAGVFTKLDESASRTEEWVAKNQKYILTFLGIIALLTVIYVLYQKFVAEPKETEAANEMFVPQQNYQQAVDGVKSDSLFALALNGSEGKLGFIQIADQYSGTDAGNLANYYAGISFLHTGKYTEAIKYLDQFKSDDKVLKAMTFGAIGDAFAQKNQLKEALEYYIKAADVDENEFTRPRYLLKAGQTELTLGNKADALKHFTEIKEKFEATPEGATIDAMIGLAQ